VWFIRSTWTTSGSIGQTRDRAYYWRRRSRIHGNVRTFPVSRSRYYVNVTNLGALYLSVESGTATGINVCLHSAHHEFWHYPHSVPCNTYPHPLAVPPTCEPIPYRLPTVSESVFVVNAFESTLSIIRPMPCSIYGGFLTIAVLFVDSTGLRGHDCKLFKTRLIQTGCEKI